MNKLPHFIILHCILLGVLVGLWFLGILPVFWEADKMFGIPIIGGLAMVSSGFVCHYLLQPRGYYAERSLEAAAWLGDKLPHIGLALTVTGLLWAANALGGDFMEPAAKKAAIDCLIGNMMGILGFVWVELVMKVCR